MYHEVLRLSESVLRTNHVSYYNEYYNRAKRCMIF